MTMEMAIHELLPYVETEKKVGDWVRAGIELAGWDRLVASLVLIYTWP